MKVNTNKNIIFVVVVIVLFFISGCSSTEVNPAVRSSQTKINEAIVIKTGVPNGKSVMVPAIVVKNNVGSLSTVGWKTYRTSQATNLSEKFIGTQIGVINLEAESLVAILIPTKISFRQNTADISTEFYGHLDYIVAVLSAYPESRIMISGFTDDSGNPKSNIEISQKRALNIATYIVKRGISGYRIATIGYGSWSYVASNSTNSGREQNRRIEIKILPPATY
ncbi:MAG: OmpA family protein [Fusobacteriaceae bacterium]